MAKIKFDSNIEDYKKQMAKAGIALQESATDAINTVAVSVFAQYRFNLRHYTNLKSRDYTLGATKIFLAHATRGNGKTLRKMEDINAVIGVPTMRDGKEHYLYQLEIGATRKGDPKIGGRVPIPLDTTRPGGNREAPIAAGFRLTKGYHMGGTIDLTPYAGNSRQQYAIMNSMARRGALNITTGVKRVSSRAYYVVKLDSDKTYLYRIHKGKAVPTRNLSMSQTKTPAEPLFEDAVKNSNWDKLDTYFLKAMQKKLAELS